MSILFAHPIASFVFFLAIFIASARAAVHAVRGAPYVPVRRDAIEPMVRLLSIRPGEKAADLGSGDGRLVIALARAGAEAHGFEHNLLAVLWSRHKIRNTGLSGQAFIHYGDFWDEDLGSFGVLTVYGIRHIMKRLGEKLRREAREGTRIVTFAFPLPDWEESAREGPIRLYRR